MLCQPLDICNYSDLIPASLITLPHLAISDFIVAASCSGELPAVSSPEFSAYFHERFVNKAVQVP